MILIMKFYLDIIENIIRSPILCSSPLKCQRASLRHLNTENLNITRRAITLTKYNLLEIGEKSVLILLRRIGSGRT